MSLFQLAIGLSFSVSDAGHHLVVAFAYLFCVAYSIGEGPVPLVSTSVVTPLRNWNLFC